MLVGVAGAFTLLEGSLRVSGVWIGRHSDTAFLLMEHDPVLGWRMKPNIAARLDLVDVEGIPVRGNAHGFWDDDWTSRRPSTRCRVAFLGDSYTWGFGVAREQRFTDLIARARPDWEVLNLGIPGYGTDQELLAWRAIGRELAPDVVVLVVYTNDYGDNMTSTRGGLPKPYFELRDGKLELRNVPVPPENFWSNGVFTAIAPAYASLFASAEERRSRVLHWLAKQSDVVRLGYTAWRWQSRAAPEVDVSRQAPLAVTGAREMRQVELLQALVEQLRDEVRERDGAFRVALAGEDRALYATQRARLAGAGIPIVDLTTPRLTTARPDAVLYYPYNRHWTPEAHRVVAGLLRAALETPELCRGVASSNAGRRRSLSPPERSTTAPERTR